MVTTSADVAKAYKKAGLVKTSSGKFQVSAKKFASLKKSGGGGSAKTRVEEEPEPKEEPLKTEEEPPKTEEEPPKTEEEFRKRSSEFEIRRQLSSFERERQLKGIYPSGGESVTIPKSTGGHTTYYESGLVETQLPGKDKQTGFIKKEDAGKFVTGIKQSREEIVSGLTEQADFIDWKSKPFVEKVKGVSYGKLQMLLAEKTTKPISRTFAKAGFTMENIETGLESFSTKWITPVGVAGFWTPKPIEKILKDYKPLQTKIEYEKGYVRGALEYIKEKPLTTGLLLGASYAIPPIIAGTKYALAGTKTQAVLSTLYKYKPIKGLLKIAKYSLPGAYVGLKGYELYKAPTPYERGKVLGRTSIELSAVIGGARLGTKTAKNIQVKTGIKKERIWADKQTKAILKGKGTGIEWKRPGKTFFKEDFGFTKRDIQSQIVKKQLIISKQSQQPLKVEYYKGRYLTSDRGIREYLGQWAQISRPKSKVQLEFITKLTTQAKLSDIYFQPSKVWSPGKTPQDILTGFGKTKPSTNLFHKIFQTKYPVFQLRTEQIIKPPSYKFESLLEVSKGKAAASIISKGTTLYSSLGLQPIQNHWEALGLLFRTKEKTGLLSIPSLLTLPRSVTGYKFDTAQIQKLDQYIPPDTITRQTSRRREIVPPPPIIVPRTPGGVPKVPPPVVPVIFEFLKPFGKQKRKKTKVRKLKRATKFQPSLVGVIKKIPRKKRKFLTGIEVRGLPVLKKMGM